MLHVSRPDHMFSLGYHPVRAELLRRPCREAWPAMLESFKVGIVVSHGIRLLVLICLLPKPRASGDQCTTASTEI